MDAPAQVTVGRRLWNALFLLGLLLAPILLVWILIGRDYPRWTKAFFIYWALMQLLFVFSYLHSRGLYFR